MRPCPTLALIWLLTGFLASCGEHQAEGPTASDKEKLQIQPTIGSDADFVDLTLQLRSHTKSADGSQEFHAATTVDGKTVGFRLRLPAQWRQGVLGGTEITSYDAGITLMSAGEESDAFVSVLGKRYGIEPTSSKMASHIAFTSMSLEGNPAAPESGTVKMKLFFAPEDTGPGSEDRYAEHFLNIDLADKQVEFREKDPSYRRPLLQALTSEK